MTQTLPLVSYEFALSQLGGNETLLVKMLSKFSNEFKSSPEDIQSLLDTDNIKDAKMLVHTAKGISGNLGLKALYAVATELDAQMRQETFTQALVDEYADVMRRTCADIDERFAPADQGGKRDLVESSHSSSESKDALLHKLGRNEFIDDVTLINLVSGLGCSDEKSQEIIKLVEELQYQPAAAIISKL